ncbi:maleylpyruvate isomerase N-terminal domain-containing protein [Frankia sp. CH37]|nr:maleylpyruvate isomerase N-terminal domain-containing protein [Parafrankia sp. CH37]
MGDLLGAYLLGSCTPAEADAVEKHLGSCAACSTDAAALLPGAPQAPARQTRARQAPARQAPAPRAPGLPGASEGHLAPPADGPGSLAAILAAALAVRPAAPGARQAAPGARMPGAASTEPGHRPGLVGAAGVPCYGNRVGALDRLLIELEAKHWHLPTATGWSVRELVLHLHAVDGLLLAALVPPGARPAPTGAHDAAGGRDEHAEDGNAHYVQDVREDALTRTGIVLDAARDWPVEKVRQRWYEQAEQLCAATERAERSQAPLTVTVDGWTAAPGDHLTSRAFETWIHTRDIAAAAGITVPNPGADDLHAMADLALRLLSVPWAAATAAATVPPPEGTLTVTLTGRGGGTWSLGPDGAQVHQARSDPRAVPADPRPASGTLTVEIVEFCLLVGDRRPASAVTARVEGDERLAAGLLALAPSLARP